MPQQDGPAPARHESFIHRVYRHVLEGFLLLFLFVAGLEFLLEKVEPVLYRWHAVVRAYKGETQAPLSPAVIAIPQPAAHGCEVGGGTQ